MPETIKLTPEQEKAEFQRKCDLFRQTADNPQARAEYAQSRAEVILPLINYQSTIRSIFRVEQLPPGASARYDLPFEDIECTWMMPHIGAIPTIQVEGAEIHVDTFGLDGGVEWQLDVARDGRFEVGRLATVLLKNRFINQEEMAGWGLIKAHAATIPALQQVQALDLNGNTTPGSGQLNIYTLNEVITVADQLGIGGRRVTDIFCSPRRFGDLRTTIYGGPALPESIRTQLWGNGQGNDNVADIRIHRVYNPNNLVDNDHAYAFTQKEGYFYGVMPIRENLTTIDNPIAILEWKAGVIGRERLGMAVLDDKGLIQVTF